MNIPLFLSRLSAVFFLSVMLLTSNNLIAQSTASIPGDFPDPTIIFANGKYYAVGTSSEWAPHFPIYSSTDLKEWKQEGFVFPETPEWTGSSFWAPEYFYQKGTYYLYYSAKRKSDGISCIGVATSEYPDRGFVDKGIVVEYGSESIDAFVLREGDDLYMTWKAYGLDKRPIELIGSKLSADGMRLEGNPFSLLSDTARVGIEGQSFIKQNGYYYMFYSAGACCGPGCDYRVQAVRSKSVQGPYEHVGETVLLGNNEDWKCMGHGTFVQNESGDYYYLFHGYNQNGNIYTGREGLMAKIEWSDKGVPFFNFVPNEIKLTTAGFHLDFTKLKKDDFHAQWDFRNSIINPQLNKKGLTVSGNTLNDNQVGVVLTWRPGNRVYSHSAKIDLKSSNENALKGIVIYGDKDRAIGIGSQNNKIIVWQAIGREFHHLKEIDLPKGMNELELKIQTKADLYCEAYYKDKSGQWKLLSPDNKDAFTLKGLAPWDRSPRPGLHVKGEANAKGVFKEFILSY